MIWSKDDAAWLQNQCDRNGYVQLPGSEMELTRPVTITRPHIRIRGAGHDYPIHLQRNGGIVFDRVYRPSMSDVLIRAQAAPFYGSAAIIVSGGSVPEGALPATDAMFDNVTVDGNNGILQYAWHFGGTDPNGEHAYLRRCRAYNFYGAAVRIDNKQSKEHLIEHCNFTGNGFSGGPAIRACGSIRVIGGAISGVPVAFSLGSPADNVVIIGTGVETCGRLLTTDGPTTAAYPITLEGVRFAADALHEDGGFVVMRTPGPLTMIGCDIGGGLIPRLPRIKLETFSQAGFNFSGNNFSGWVNVDGTTLVLNENRLFDYPDTAFERREVVHWGINTWATGGDPNCEVR